VQSVSGEGATVAVGPGALLCANTEGVAPGDQVTVFMRPESFRLSRRQHSDDAWSGVIEFAIYHGDCWDYHVRLGDDLLKVRVYREKVGLEHGDAVFLEPDGESAIVMPKQSAEAAPSVAPEQERPQVGVA
jgi:iron(III) transport system ATP-binding protein